MKTKNNILLAFILNLGFSIFEFFGGAFTGSVAIVSDAVHDLGDAISIGLAYILERKSNDPPDEHHTYGYLRYSVFGGLITTVVLLCGSAVVIYKAFERMFGMREIDYDGMIVFAVVGVCVNFCAAYFTHEGGSLNRRAVNLHMIEDVLGWSVVLVGAVIMRFTNVSIIDPIMSVGVSAFVVFNALKNLKSIVELLLERSPNGLGASTVKKHTEEINGVIEAHHIHLWSVDGTVILATMHVVSDGQPLTIKKEIREKLRPLGIGHITIELETSRESCCEKRCPLGEKLSGDDHHHSLHSHHH